MHANANVNRSFWLKLYSGTALWKDRSTAAICRYALQELSMQLAHIQGAPQAKPEKGLFYLRVRATTREEKNQWRLLASHYGSIDAAFAVALQFLHDSLVFDPAGDVDAEDSGLVGQPVSLTAAEVSRLRKQHAIAP